MVAANGPFSGAGCSSLPLDPSRRVWKNLAAQVSLLRVLRFSVLGLATLLFGAAPCHSACI